ncbi:hypothetical protein NP493_719g01000 [Ridgeia piscesae]|uniref:Uncharacterized protein n=1 Tax=Ridgeia piscesae TaxID=27915 RepID=A0AAD9KQB6_RIDPI|nr:hypothetical protein NP493_719g01000 [Ridgeia piscesae]
MSVYQIVILLMLAPLVRQAVYAGDPKDAYNHCLSYCWSVYTRCMRRGCPYTDLTYQERITKCWKSLEKCDKGCSEFLTSE